MTRRRRWFLGPPEPWPWQLRLFRWFWFFWCCLMVVLIFSGGCP